MADIRCRISAKPSGAEIVYGPKEDSNILRPLWDKNGLTFPFTPTVTTGGVADYEEYTFTHAQYRYNAYTRSYPTEIVINGDFTAQTQDEARYLLAVMHFLKSATKGYFGSSNTTRAGTPPPVLLFNYLGDNQFKNVPVIIKNFNYTLEPNIDYVPVLVNNDPNRKSWVPTKVNILVTVDTYYNPRMLRDTFDLDKFLTGKLLGGTDGTNEGFI